ncbi:GH25 family lysozyme [uncultured Ruminococcus sp.]|uniref:GH25 family lysozyme n=1 Tax=uncultured Ruminococcus sp. TaxID=165186 RepID=UPI0025F21C88|nr:GH25 family lysozyme [uncultured Ruminococcus sp.]
MAKTFKGIDVSQYQQGVDFKKVKASGVDFVIIRAGFGKYANQKDPCFESHYKAAKAAGLKVGAYWYSYAATVEEAKAEAQTCINAIKGKTFEYPIYFDLEERSQFVKGRAFCDSLVKTFCNALESAGYWAGLYISRSPLQQYISTDVAKRYALWVAEYGSRCNYGGTYGMWQYSSTGKVNGISGNVDMDICYVDYPTLIKAKGLNGFKKVTSSTSKPSTTTAKKVVTYTVKRGDTLSAIAQRYKTTVAKLVKDNGIKNANLIYVGQKIKIK